MHDSPVANDGPTALGAVELLPGLVRAAVVDGDGAIRHLIEREFDTSGDVGAVEAVISDVIQQCFTFHRVRGIGVASPGLVDTTSGVVVESLDLPQLNGLSLAALIAGQGRAPAFVEHRARLQALGDRWFGHGRGRRSFASVSTGETLGVGILFEGQIIAPPGGRSGAHMIVAAHGEVCTCGSAGCWKTVATTAWLRQQATGAGMATADVAGLASLAETGDAPATRLLSGYADNIALGLINIQHLFAPGRFILHGDARWAGREFCDRIERRLLEVTSWNVEAERPQVVVADVDEDASTLLGGAGLVLTRLG
ncbi:ROK family protein [Phytoactinopolyspora halotolerans]|uniref:ROK family protein n=1 Tax=Phytoactinopolyspora halotolerans TaxID=1981512 RepID=A0A6L9S181_9ACTN|nr:ROK family protein [Phytoactinopolyspora halotolerans]NED99234.1 ROK family protein [Phytoactinopolyspora halotolerans]